MIIQNQTATITFDPPKTERNFFTTEPFKRTFLYKRKPNLPTALITWEVRVKELNQLVGTVCQYKDPFYNDNYGSVKADRFFWIGYSIQHGSLPVIAKTRKEVTKKMYLNLD